MKTVLFTFPSGNLILLWFKTMKSNNTERFRLNRRKIVGRDAECWKKHKILIKINALGSNTHLLQSTEACFFRVKHTKHTSKMGRYTTSWSVTDLTPSIQCSIAWLFRKCLGAFYVIICMLVLSMKRALSLFLYQKRFRRLQTFYLLLFVTNKWFAHGLLKIITAIIDVEWVFFQWQLNVNPLWMMSPVSDISKANKRHFGALKLAGYSLLTHN